MTPLERAHHRYSLVVAAFVSIAVVVLLVIFGTADDAAGRGEPRIGTGTGGVSLEPVGDGTFEEPVNVAFAPGSSANVYVVEQGGTVEVIVGNVESGDFLDIGHLTRSSGERGLLGLAFHPAFQANGLVYAYYTDRDTGDIVVSEFPTASATDAIEAGAREVIRIPHRARGNHNGGQLLFGEDGYLYMAPGDGGSGEHENAQRKQSLLGKVLRIDPLDPPGAASYTTPQSNPFKGRPGADEILARGLRNPFRFSFDGNRILIGDVGEQSFEEVDYETAKSLRKANFGWDRFEGLTRHEEGRSRTPKPKKHDRPIHVYDHGTDGFSCAVTGGVVVRDQRLTNLYGRYLYADFCAGRLRSFVPRLGGARDVKALSNTFRSPTSFTADPVTSRVYVTSLEGPVRVLNPQG